MSGTKCGILGFLITYFIESARMHRERTNDALNHGRRLTGEEIEQIGADAGEASLGGFALCFFLCAIASF